MEYVLKIKKKWEKPVCEQCLEYALEYFEDNWEVLGNTCQEDIHHECLRMDYHKGILKAPSDIPFLVEYIEKLQCDLEKEKLRALDAEEKLAHAESFFAIKKHFELK